MIMTFICLGRSPRSNYRSYLYFLYFALVYAETGYALVVVLVYTLRRLTFNDMLFQILSLTTASLGPTCGRLTEHAGSPGTVRTAMLKMISVPLHNTSVDPGSGSR